MNVAISNKHNVLTCLHQHNISILLLVKLKLQQNLLLPVYQMRNSLQPATNFQGKNNHKIEFIITLNTKDKFGNACPLSFYRLTNQFFPILWLLLHISLYNNKFNISTVTPQTEPKLQCTFLAPEPLNS